jgi:hypothetical protein
VLALCRLLCAAGYDPALALEAYRGAVLCLRVRHIGIAAALTVDDGPNGTPRFRRWPGSEGNTAAGYVGASPIEAFGRAVS